MVLESVGILISLRPFNERDAIAQIFTMDYGVVVGMLRGAVVAKKNKPLVGQVGNMTWNARLDSQLGVLHWGAEKNMVAELMVDAQKLMMMNSAFEILGTLLPERESFPVLYQDTINMLTELTQNKSDAYLNWEIGLLRELGYALDLSRCSGCGVCDDLHYVSPRTGRAVCEKCAQPYLDKLYKMPVSLGMTYRFIENVCLQQGVKVPVSRSVLKML
jgi:DNA repair protein RecO (recombination protein O)